MMKTMKLRYLVFLFAAGNLAVFAQTTNAPAPAPAANSAPVAVASATPSGPVTNAPPHRPAVIDVPQPPQPPRTHAFTERKNR